MTFRYNSKYKTFHSNKISRNVIPRKLLENGFKFKFGNLENAFQNLVSK